MGGHESAEELKVTLEQIKAQDESKLSPYHRDLLKWSRNVDKRYAWIILLAYWLAMVATLGPYRIYGLIYAKVTNEGIYTRAEASWPSSMIFSVENFVGPLVSVIAYHLSYRQSFFIGGLLVTLGNGLTAFSGSVLMDTILIGFVQGVGCAFLFMPFMEIINNYFLKYRTIAVGVSLCGGTMAIFILSPIFQWLVERYPWRYSYYGLGLVASITLFMVPLMKANPRPSPPKTTLNGPAAGIGDRRNTFSRLSARALSYQNSLRRQSSFLMTARPFQRQGSVVSVNPFASTVGLERKISRAIPIENEPTTGEEAIDGNAAQQKAANNKLSGDIMSLHRNQLCKPEQFESVSLSESGVSEQENGGGAQDGDDENIDAAMIWDILKTPVFYIICYQEFVYFWVFGVYTLILVDYGIDCGLTQHQATLLLNFQSVGEILGRAVLTILVDLQGFLSERSVVILVFLLLACSLTLVSIVSGFVWLAGSTVAVMALTSLLYIVLNGLLVSYFGERKVTLCYGMSSFVSGALLIVRPTVVGYFRDTLGSYDLLMVSMGIACAIGGLLWAVEPLISRCCGSKGRHTVAIKPPATQ